jgi:hypothetical protein
VPDSRLGRSAAGHSGGCSAYNQDAGRRRPGMAGELLSLLGNIAEEDLELSHLETAAVLFHRIGSCEIGHLLPLD